MKNFLERLKDFIYNYIDFVMIILVIVLIGGIIFWRLDILFGDTNIDESTEEIKTEEPKEKPEKESDPKQESKVEEEKEEETPPQEDTSKVDENIKISIEQGSSSETVAQTLFDKKLINDKRKFLLRLSDLDLETNIHPGNFELNKNSDIDTIINLLPNKI